MLRTDDGRWYSTFSHTRIKFLDSLWAHIGCTCDAFKSHTLPTQVWNAVDNQRTFYLVGKTHPPLAWNNLDAHLVCILIYSLLQIGWQSPRIFIESGNGQNPIRFVCPLL
jgi:hypothetical protein